MPSRNWLSHAPLGVGLVIVLALMIAASIKSPDQRCPPDCGQQAATQKHCKVATCPDWFLPIVREPEPPAREENPTRDQWRQEQDLKAQFEQARWALAAAIAAFVSAFATITGIYFLTNSDANRAAVEVATKTTNIALEANQLGREAFIASERPWVTTEILPGGPLTYGQDGGLTLTLKFRVEI